MELKFQDKINELIGRLSNSAGKLFESLVTYFYHKNGLTTDWSPNIENGQIDLLSLLDRPP